MWSKVAEEMTILWRAAEAMHWKLGEQEMARRADIVRRELVIRSMPPQLSSVPEMTGVPAYAPNRVDHPEY